MTDPAAVGGLAARVRAGEVRAIARAISLAEEGNAADVLAELAGPARGGTHVVGITGPPGVGKSTLVDALARGWLARGQAVGVLAVDPTSPFSGGALLGDRIRMQELAKSDRAYIRSMATRGAVGGLAEATADAAAILEAAGMDVVLVETVGVGQDEIDVAAVADTVVVVLVPGLGDEIQALKAGIIEIGDVFVINKADLPGAERAASELASMLEPGPGREVLRTAAHVGEGVEALRDAIDGHRARLAAALPADPGSLHQRRRRQARQRLARLLHARLAARVEAEVLAHVADEVLDGLAARRLDPHAVARELYDSWKLC